MRCPLPAIIRNTGGATIVEFALIAPAALLMLMGVFDLGYNMYATTAVMGSVQEAARNSSIEGATTTIIDQKVTDAVHMIVPDASLNFSRRYYTNFTDVGRAEAFNDLNNDLTCNNGEPFEDVNGNGMWDNDRGRLGQGGARDAVLYEVTVDYPRAFPLAGMIGISPNYTTKVATILRNQPYSLQGKPATTGNCI